MSSEHGGDEVSDRFEWLDTQPLTASSQTRLTTVMTRMVDCPDVTCILAVHRQKLLGIATRGDLIRAISLSADWPRMRLSQVVTRPVIAISPPEVQAIAPLLEKFEHHQISHLPVIDDRSRVVGLVTQARLLKTLHRQGAESSLHQHQRAHLFSEITLKIRQSLQLKEILQTTVNEVQQLLNADRVLIYQVLPDGTGQPISEAVVAPYPAVLGMTFPEEVFPKEYQALYAQGRVQSIPNIQAPDSGVSPCLVEFTEQWGIQAKMIVPIVHPLKPSAEKAPLRRHLWGLLIVHQCRSPRHWSDFELDLMQQLAGQISLALSQGQLLEYLEDRVNLRTAELTQANLALKQEIQERKQVEKALRRSEAQLRLVTNNLPVLIAYVDRRQRYRFNNQVYEQWLGKSPDAIKGKLMKSVMGAEHYQQIQSHIERVLAGEQVTYESELTFKGGQVRSVSVDYIPHVEGDGKGSHFIKGFFALTSDISDRKAIERMKDEFIAVVSHELRTPLTSIHSSLKLMATGRLGQLSEDGQQMLEVADENTDRLVRLVNNVLDLQRIESGEVTMDAYGCDTAELIAEAAEAMRSIAQQHNIEIKTQSVSLAIWADPDYIMQTLTNLLGNAIKFSTPGNAIHLSVRPHIKPALPPKQLKKRLKQRSNPRSKRQPARVHNVAQDPPAMALFSVQDYGQGIPSQNLNSIFERFQQVDSSDSRKKGGTGLGLTICRKIVEQHGGTIWAESQVGVGSCFYFTIPLSSNATLSEAPFP